MFVLWERVASLPLLLRWSRGPNPTPSCVPSARDIHAAADLMPYPRRLLGDVSVRLVSVSYHKYNPPRSTAQASCDSPQPLPYWMLSVLIAGTGGRGGWWICGSRAMCRPPAPWEVGWDKVTGILVQVKKEGKRRKIPVLATVGSTVVIFWITTLSSIERV